jgi:hypothetical protein
MHNRLSRLLPLFVMALLLGGCLQSQAPLVADSAYSDGFAGTYAVTRAGTDETPRTITLERSGQALTASETGEDGKPAPTGQRYRFWPYGNDPDDAIVQQESGGTVSYALLRRSGDRADLWTIACDRIPPSARKALDLAGSGGTCRATTLGQVESTIKAYLRTDPRPDYTLAIVQQSRSNRLMRALGKEVSETLTGDRLGLENAADRLGNLAATGNEAGDSQTTPGDGVLTRAMAPLRAAGSAISEGDWQRLWSTIAQSWLLFGLIGLLAFLLLGSVCRRH